MAIHNITVLVLKPWHGQSFLGLLWSSAMRGLKIKFTRRLGCCNAKCWVPSELLSSGQSVGNVWAKLDIWQGDSETSTRSLGRQIEESMGTIPQRVWHWPERHLLLLWISVPLHSVYIYCSFVHRQCPLIRSMSMEKIWEGQVKSIWKKIYFHCLRVSDKEFWNGKHFQVILSASEAPLQKESMWQSYHSFFITGMHHEQWQQQSCEMASLKPGWVGVHF